MCLNPLQILSLLIFKLSYLWSMKTQAVWLPHCCLFGVVILSLVYLFIEVIRLFPTAFNMYFYIHYWHSTVRWIFLFSTFVYCLFHYVSMDLWFFQSIVTHYFIIYFDPLFSRYGQSEPLPTNFCAFDMSSFFFEYFLTFWLNRCSWLILYFLCHIPGTGCFSKEL